MAILLATIAVGARILEKDGVVSVSLYVLLKILGPLEGFTAELASMRLQGDMNANVRGDMVAFHDSDSAAIPITGKVEVVGTLAPNVALADVILSIVPGVSPKLGAIRRGKDYIRRAVQRWQRPRCIHPNGIRTEYHCFVAVARQPVAVVVGVAVPADADADGSQAHALGFLGQT